MSNWKEQFEKFTWNLHNEDCPCFEEERGKLSDCICGVREVLGFISTEIIEKLIANIPDDAIIDANLDTPKVVTGTIFKQQLRDKWL